jgi:teichuronic acid biosynthesis glycosyltransferase TuaC
MDHDMRILTVTNMYPTPRAPASGIFVEQQIHGLRQIGLDIDVIFVDRAQKGMKAYMGLGQKVRTRIKDLQPDLVHVMYGGVMADQVTRTVHDRPTVVTFHGSDLLGEPLSGLLRKLIAGYGVWVSWRAARRASGIVVVSKILQDALPEDLDSSKVKVIPCGIDIERFKPLNRDTCRDQLGWAANRFHVLFPTSSGNPLKRPGLARAALEAVNRFGIHGEMHQLQGVAYHEVPVWLNASDVVLLTSLHEGSPTIIKEALACNRPVVSVDVGDVRERLQGIEGCYIALPDPNDLAAKLYLVYASSCKVVGRSKMQEFSLEHVGLRLKEFYGEVLASHKKNSQPDVHS